MSELILNLLGDFEARTGSGAVLSFPTKKTKALLAYLAVRPGKGHTRSNLASLLWGESGEEQARASLRQALTYLRRALAPEGHEHLVVKGDVVSIAAATVEVDVATLESLIAQGVPEALDRAADLYRGDFLEGFDLREEEFNDWLRAERAHLRALVTEALKQLLAQHMAGDELARGVRVAHRLLAIDPLQEDVHRTLMRLHLRQGERALALKQYETCQEILLRELGIEPDDETRRIRAEARAGGPSQGEQDEGGPEHPAALGTQRVKNITQPIEGFAIAPNGAATGTAVASRRRFPRSVQIGAALAAVVILLGTGYATGIHRVFTDTAGPNKNRIAVLPFVNMSADAGDEYFSDGITEELITQLSKVGELSVLARTSTARYKDTDKSIAEIGRELRVGSILEGSVRRAGDQLRITAQLIDVASETHLWAEDYDRDFDDIFAIQSDIAADVANSLQIRLLEPEQQRIDTPGTTSTEAYELYLEVIYRMGQDSVENIDKAIEAAQRAIEIDPDYADAYGALAQLTLFLLFRTDSLPTEIYRRARENAEKALVLDDTSARAHLALAQIKMVADWDWVGAIAEFERAIELNPSFVRARADYATFLLMMFLGKGDEALAEMESALALDPLSRRVLGGMGWVRYHRREYDEAISAFRRVQDLYPSDPFSYIGVGQSLVWQGQHEAGIAEIKKGIAIAPIPIFHGFLGWAYGIAGRLDEAEAVVAELTVGAETKDVSPMPFAWVYLGMDDNDKTIDWLEKAVAERDASLIWLRTPAFYDVLFGEPRYQALLEKMGLES